MIRAQGARPACAVQAGRRPSSGPQPPQPGPIHLHGLGTPGRVASTGVDTGRQGMPVLAGHSLLLELGRPAGAADAPPRPGRPLPAAVARAGHSCRRPAGPPPPPLPPRSGGSAPSPDPSSRTAAAARGSAARRGRPGRGARVQPPPHVPDGPPRSRHAPRPPPCAAAGAIQVA